MPSAPSELAYRPCAGIVLTRAGKVFAGQRLNPTHDAWQMPQGGIDAGETPEGAALRELEEETGVGADKVTILAQSEGWLYYDIPQDVREQFWDGEFRGQKQKWFLMRLDADDSAIEIETAHQEFLRWQWMTPEEVFSHVVPFKRDVYRQVFEAFGAYFSR